MNHPTFTTTAQRRLTEFLSAPERHPDSLCYPELAGFLFGVCCSPEMIRPSEWLEIVLDDNDPGYRDAAEAQAVLGDLMSFYNQINAGVMSAAPELPMGCDWHDPLLANFDAAAPISQWSRGFGLAYDWLLEIWDEAVPEDWSNDMGGTMIVLSFFASRSLAEAYQQETQRAGSLEDMAAQMRQLFPHAMREFAAIGRSLAEMPPARAEPARSTKVPRNAPCPCGSGKKYKQCCGLRH